MFNREDSMWFNKRHLFRANMFYEKHGGKAIILARFLPFVRTFAPIVAGMARMSYPKFLAYNVAGGLSVGCWSDLGRLSPLLGSIIPDIDRYLLPIIALIIVASLRPRRFTSLRQYERRSVPRRR